MKNIKYILFIVALGFFFTACDEILEINPSGTEVVLEADALKTESDVEELLNSAYDALGGVYGGSYQRSLDMLGDDMIFKPGVNSVFYRP
jgi:hypothetical protein